jgi:hypothetical protein
MMMQTKVLIADDRPRSRSGLRAVLALRPEIEIVGEAADGQEGVRLMDARMPVMDGVEATRLIKEEWPEVRVVVLTIHAAYWADPWPLAPTPSWSRDVRLPGYARAVLRRLSAVLVSTNLALAGLLAINLPLINWHLNYCGFSGLTVLPWWAIAVLGTLVGGLLLCVYHTWVVRRGFTAWSALLWDTGEAGDGTTAVSSPPWRRLWLWILLSFVALVTGMTLGVMGAVLAASVTGSSSSIRRILGSR